MLHCILGVLLASCSHNANITIPGKVAYAQTGYASAWNYGAYYSVPIQTGSGIVMPGYANPFPPLVLASIDRPGQFNNVVRPVSTTIPGARY